MEKEKKNKGLIAIVIVLILVIIGLIVYICYDKEIIRNTRKEEMAEKSKKEINRSDKAVEEKDEIKPLETKIPIKGKLGLWEYKNNLSTKKG